MAPRHVDLGSLHADAPSHADVHLDVATHADLPHFDVHVDGADLPHIDGADLPHVDGSQVDLPHVDVQPPSHVDVGSVPTPTEIGDAITTLSSQVQSLGAQVQALAAQVAAQRSLTALPDLGAVVRQIAQLNERIISTAVNPTYPWSAMEKAYQTTTAKLAQAGERAQLQLQQIREELRARIRTARAGR